LAYLHQHHLKSEDVFDNRLVAQETLRYLLETSRIPDEQALETVAQCSPFLARNLRPGDIDAVRTRISDFKSKILSPHDLSKLSQEDFLAAKTEELKKDAIRPRYAKSPCPILIVPCPRFPSPDYLYQTA